MGHFTNKDLEAFALQLLNQIPNSYQNYPKVSIGATKILCLDNQVADGGVECKKKKLSWKN